jgi:hypothetical protein
VRKHALIAALALPLLAGAGTAADTVMPDPKKLVLQLADLPTGFEFKSGRYISNAQLARETKEPVWKFTRWGRVNGYDADYEKPVALSSLLKGPTAINATATVYRRADGAHRAYADNVGPGLRKRDPQRKFKRLAVGAPLGDESRLYTYADKRDGVRVRVFVAYWRSGRFTARVITGGVEGGIDAESAVDLAKRQQARIQRVAR